jgi:hypothetical protein
LKVNKPKSFAGISYQSRYTPRQQEETQLWSGSTFYGGRRTPETKLTLHFPSGTRQLTFPINPDESFGYLSRSSFPTVHAKANVLSLQLSTCWAGAADRCQDKDKRKRRKRDPPLSHTLLSLLLSRGSSDPHPWLRMIHYRPSRYCSLGRQGRASLLVRGAFFFVTVLDLRADQQRQYSQDIAMMSSTPSRPRRRSE